MRYTLEDVERLRDSIRGLRTLTKDMHRLLVSLEDSPQAFLDRINVTQDGKWSHIDNIFLRPLKDMPLFIHQEEPGFEGIPSREAYIARWRLSIGR